MLAFCHPVHGERTSRGYSSLFAILIALTSSTSCTTVAQVASPAPLPRHSTLERLSPALPPKVHQAASTRLPDTATSRQGIEKVPARFKLSMAVAALHHPWKGLADLEQHGLLLTQLAEGGTPNLPALLKALEAGMDRHSELPDSPPLPQPTTPEATVTAIVHTLELAASHRDRALQPLTQEDRTFLFQHGANWTEYFTPHYSSQSAQTMAQLTANLHVTSLLTEHADYTELITSAQILAR